MRPAAMLSARTTLILLLTFNASLSLGLRLSNNGSMDIDTFDYVIVGCGIAGIVVAARLSEDANITVLCLEAGDFDNYEPMIQYPVYIGLQPPLFYEWGVTTTPQMQLDGAVRQIPMGKGVGGGSLINGMIWNRGNEADFDIWGKLGNSGWSWAEILPYFRKSETFTPISYVQQNDPDTFEPRFHGYKGPAQVSYPQYLWPQSKNWFDALKQLGVHKCLDPNDGQSAGGYFLPLSIHSINQTRSDARRTYYDPYSERPNYHVLAKAQATRILFDRNAMEKFVPQYDNFTRTSHPTPSKQKDAPRATGVNFVVDPAAPRQTVFARHEIILAAGAIHTPQLLELSGIGSKELLQGLGIPLVQDLLGVGSNLQDHPLIHLNYSYQNPDLLTPFSLVTNTTFNLESEQQYLTSKCGPWTAKPSTAVAFPSLSQIANLTKLNTSLLLTAQNHNHSLAHPSMSPSLLASLRTQHHHILHSLSSPSTPAFEILNSNSGSLDLSLMRPFSRGTVHITTSSPLSPPAVDPNWLDHPLDKAIMLAAMRFNQYLLDTAPLQDLMPSYDHVPRDASDIELEAILKRDVGTEFHYAGTAAMLPRELGGVVDSQLRVHGVHGLRVVDSSVFPVVPGAHLQSVVYAVAEKAADIIRGRGVEELVKDLDNDVPAEGYFDWLLGGERDEM